MTTLLIGERFNIGRRIRRWEDCALDEPEYWIEISRRAGCFRAGIGRARLLSLGLEWDSALNLLPPSDRGEWDRELAERVANAVRWRIVTSHECMCDDWQCVAWRFDRVVLLGRRVARAMGFAHLKLCEFDGGAICVPHPSGLNRWWNDPSNLESARAQIARWRDVVFH